MEEKERTNQERYKSRTFWQEGDTIELKHGWRSCDGWCSGHPRASGALLPPATIPQRPSEGLVRPENPESLSLNCQSGCSLHPIPELTFYTPVLPYLFFFNPVTSSRKLSQIHLPKLVCHLSDFSSNSLSVLVFLTFILESLTMFPRSPP